MDILDVVCNKLKVNSAEARKKCRKSEIVSAKRVVIHIMRQRGKSYSIIGRFLKCDRTTVIHNLNHTTEEEKALGDAILSKIPENRSLLYLNGLNFKDLSVKKKIKLYDYKANRVIEKWITPKNFKNGGIIC